MVNCDCIYMLSEILTKFEWTRRQSEDETNEKKKWNNKTNLINYTLFYGSLPHLDTLQSFILRARTLSLVLNGLSHV